MSEGKSYETVLYISVDKLLLESHVVWNDHVKNRTVDDWSSFKWKPGGVFVKGMDKVTRWQSLKLWYTWRNCTTLYRSVENCCSKMLGPHCLRQEHDISFLPSPKKLQIRRFPCSDLSICLSFFLPFCVCVRGVGGREGLGERWWWWAAVNKGWEWFNISCAFPQLSFCYSVILHWLRESICQIQVLFAGIILTARV